jgi:SAM-dependent methyltransferase
VPGAALEIVERDDGFIAATDAARYFGPPSVWPAEETMACDLAEGRVLDIGCGPGRHAVELRRRGLDVTGLEPSPAAAEVAEHRGVPVLRRTIEQVGPDGSGWDTFLLLGNNLGLLGSPEHAGAVLDRLAGAARPGARILAAGNDPYRTEAPEHLAYHARNRALGRPGGQLRIRVRDRSLATPWFDYLNVSRTELAGIVAPSRWRLEIRDGDDPGYLAVLRLS